MRGIGGRSAFTHFEAATDETGRQYNGHDIEHLSINYLCAFALLTGDRQARRECGYWAKRCWYQR